MSGSMFGKNTEEDVDRDGKAFKKDTENLTKEYGRITLTHSAKTKEISELRAIRASMGITGNGKLSRYKFDNTLKELCSIYSCTVEHLKMVLADDLAAYSISSKRLLEAYLVILNVDKEATSVSAVEVYGKFFEGKQIVLRQVADHLTDDILVAAVTAIQDPGPDIDAFKVKNNVIAIFGERASKFFDARTLKKAESAIRNDNDGDFDDAMDKMR